MICYMQPHLGSSDAAEPTLSQLRGQIKKVMIPLLIKIFELKLSAQQAKSPPSRLHRTRPESLEDVSHQLEALKSDLNVLHLWCASCEKQIERALKEIEHFSASPQSVRVSTSKASDGNNNLFQKFFGK